MTQLPIGLITWFMKTISLNLGDATVLEPKCFEDDRGYFYESYSFRTLAELGVDTVFVQDNHSLSRQAGTLRGIHFQNNPRPLVKLVRCTRGRIKSVIVDLRRDSPAFRQWVSVELSADNRRQLLVPAGFGNSFLTLEDDSEVQYKISGFYEPSLDRAIRWCDPDLAIDWGIEHPILSARDRDAPLLRDSDGNLTLRGNP